MIRIITLTFVFSISCLALNAQSIFGEWKTIDDDGKTEKSIFEIYETENGTVEGKVLKLLDPTSKTHCDKCDGDKKGKPITGMVLLQDLKKDGDNYEGGTILDPTTGKVYSCYITLEEPNKLKVRGYMGFALIGRTQYWYRVE